MEVKGMRVDLNRVNLGQLKAFADVTFVSPVGELTIRGFRVLQEEGKTPWVGMPTTNYTKNGKVERKRILDMTRSTQKILSQIIVGEFERVDSSSL